MIIDTDYLRKLYIPHIKRVAKDEVFFRVPNASWYAISNYGRFYGRSIKGAWHIQHPKNGKVEIVYDDSNEIREVDILELIRQTFFGNAPGELLNLNTDRNTQFDIKKIVYAGNETENQIIWFTDKPILDWLHTEYYGMRTRATNPKVKKMFPVYEKTTMSKDWLKHSNHCKQYLLDISYYYPQPLEVDKDLISCGEVDEYREGNVILLPNYINNMVTYRPGKYGYGIQPINLSDGTVKYYFTAPRDITQSDRESLRFDTYEETLIAARKKRYELYHRVVENEWEAGYLPEYILGLLEELADGTLKGIVKLKEPTDEILKQMGVKV